MKNAFSILSVIGFLLASVGAQAADWGILVAPGNPPPMATFVKLFACEAQIPKSPLHRYLAKLKADYPDSTIDDTITIGDVIRLESGADARNAYSSYLIFVRSGYQSNTTTAGYLSAETTASSEDDSGPTTFRITGEAHVSIE
jgi:hypothetical protein